MKKIRILFTGGGSGGPVTPLLAVAETWREQAGPETDFLWLGTDQGPEQAMVERENIPFRAIKSGKLRRYFSWRNFFDPFLVLIGFFQSLLILARFRPQVVMSAGASVSVPVAFAAFICRIPLIIHQQDVRPGLANKLMAPFARLVTVTFEKSLLDYGAKAVWIGNPIRQDFCKIKLTKREAGQKFGLRGDKPVLFITGGGTGAVSINQLVLESMSELGKFCQVIHVTGQGKASQANIDLSEKDANYKFFEFLDVFGMMKGFAVAEVMVSRCGMGTLTELSQLGVVSVLIPMPESHQEENAAVFAANEAALVLKENELDQARFVTELKSLMFDEARKAKYRENIKQVMKPFANEAMLSEIKKLIKL